MQVSLSIVVLLEVIFQHIFFTWSTSDPVQAVFHFHKVKESMLMHCLVWVFFRKVVKPLGHIFESKEVFESNWCFVLEFINVKLKIIVKPIKCF